MSRRRPALPSAATLRALLRSATAAVDAVGATVCARHRPAPRGDVRRKGEGDFVTALDLSGERRLRRALLGAHPHHGFLGEETGGFRPEAEFVWVVDPIDGTSNFAQGLPQFAVAAACLYRGMPVVAACHCSPEGVTYTAVAGQGARRAGRRIRTPRVGLDDASVVGVQWIRGAWEPHLLEPVCRSGARVRTFGCTVTQICDVACGRLHANVQTQGKVWDVAACGLVAVEAGARFTDWSGAPILPFEDPFTIRDYPSLTAPEPFHGRLRRLLEGAVVSRP